MEAVVMLDGGEDYEEKGFEEMKIWLGFRGAAVRIGEERREGNGSGSQRADRRGI
jgi:hypothetical protein